MNTAALDRGARLSVLFYWSRWSMEVLVCARPVHHKAPYTIAYSSSWPCRSTSMTSLLEDLRAQITDIQRAALTACWKHYCEYGEWINIRLLHKKQGGKSTARPALEDLGGSIVFEQADATTTRYQLTLLGVLLTDEGKQYEELLAQYLRFLITLSQQDPERNNVKSEEVAVALNLTQEQTFLLSILLYVGEPFRKSMGGYRTLEWNADIPDNIEDLPSGLLEYVQQRAIERYYSDAPLAALPRDHYYQRLRLTELQAQNQGPNRSLELSTEEIQQFMNIDENLLFEDDLFKLRNEYRQRMSKELLDYDKDHILSVDIDKACIYLADKFGLDVPVLSDDYEVLEPTYTTIAIKQTGSDIRGHGFTHVSGLKVEYIVPFSGNALLFGYRTEVQNHSPIRGTVIDNELHLSYLLQPEFKPSDIEAIYKEFQHQLELIREYLDWSRQDAQARICSKREGHDDAVAQEAPRFNSWARSSIRSASGGICPSPRIRSWM
jgi:hypothetical protein